MTDAVPERPLEELARAAAGGDRDALERVCAAIRDPIYRLALRMLSSPADAEDCTQDIMVQVVTHLGSFEGRSQLMTWVYKIASRHLMRTRKREVESSVKGAEAFAAWLDAHQAAEPYRAESALEYRELCEEVRIGCTYGMLLCLSRELRLAYILGDLLELTDKEGAAALDITAAAFRQRLKRARETVRPILKGRCSVYDPAGTCRCDRQIQPSFAHGLIPATGPVYTRLPCVREAAREPRFARAAEQLDLVHRFAEGFRDDPAFAAPPSVTEHLRTACPDLFA
jgi:RNA polymerase sigma factor (sigma-70 family)